MIVQRLNFLFSTFLEKFKTAFIYHSFHLITGINPLKLIVTAKGEAKDTQSNKAGIYILGPNPVNSKPHWLQITGTHAIWYNEEKEIWAIGLQKSLGSDKAWIYSSDDVASPQEATTWIYFNKEWITSDDILVDTFVEPGTYK